LCVIDARGRRVTDPQRDHTTDGCAQGSIAPRLADGPRGGNSEVRRGACDQAVCARVHLHAGGGGHNKFSELLQRERHVSGVYAVPRDQS